MGHKRQPTPDAPRPIPLLWTSIDPEQRGLMHQRASGKSFNDIEDYYDEEEKLDSRSASSLHRDYTTASEELLHEFNTRPLHNVDLAAILMDGTPMGGDMVVWAMGITHDGYKVPLGLIHGPGESSDIVEAMFDNWAARGLNFDNALVIVDGGQAIQNGTRRATHGRARIQGCRVHLQRLVLSKFNKPERDAIEQELRAKLTSGWARSRYERARAALEDTARWLDDQGYGVAADTLRRGMHDTLMLQRLGINNRTVRHSLDSTNPIESPHRAVKEWKETVDFWQSEEPGAPAEAPAQSDGRKPRKSHGGMRKRAFATIIAKVERRWGSVAHRRALEDVSFAVMKSRYLDGEWAELTGEDQVTVSHLPTGPQAYTAIRDLMRWADGLGKTVTLDALGALASDGRLSAWLGDSGFDNGTRAPRMPGELDWGSVAGVDFTFENVPIPAHDAEAARELVRAALGLAADGAPEIVCVGSGEALGTLGLEAGGRATLEQLTTAARGRHATDDADAVRHPAPLKLVDVNGKETGVNAQGVMAMRWRLVPARGVTERWLDGTVEERAHIERALAESAEAAIGHVVDSERSAVAYAVGTGDADAPALSVDGVVLGAMHEGRLVSPKHESVLPTHEAELERVRYEAGDVATVLLDADLVSLTSQAGLGMPRPGAEWSSDYLLAALGPVRGQWIADRAEFAQTEPVYERRALGDWPLKDLTKAREALEKKAFKEDPFAALDLTGALRARTLEQRRSRVAARLEQDPKDPTAQQALGHIDRELRELDQSKEGPNWWMRRFRWAAVETVAFERAVNERAGAIAKDGGVRHLLEDYRGRLGGRRVRELAAQADEQFEASSKALTEDDASSMEQLAQQRKDLSDELEPAGKELDQAARTPHGSQEKLDGWMKRWAKGAAKLVGLQAAINHHVRAREVAAAQEAGMPEAATAPEAVTAAQAAAAPDIAVPEVAAAAEVSAAGADIGM